MSSKKHNPVIVTAQKHIPAQKRWVEDTAQWVKAHKMTISLTVEGVLALYALYSAAQNARDVLEVKSVERTTKDAAYARTRDNAKYVIARIDAKLRDPNFQEYLRKYHKITNLRPLYKMMLRGEED